MFRRSRNCKRTSWGLGLKQGKRYKPNETDRVFVERCVQAGDRINDIASALNLSDDTLRKYYKYEIMTARMDLKASAVRVMVDSLEDGSLDAAKYVLARVAGWSERSNVDVTTGGDKIEKSSLDVTKLSPDAMREILKAHDDTESG